MLEKLRGNPSIRPEKQRNLPLNVPSVEMRHGHWGRSRRRFTVYLGVVTRRNFGPVAAKPNSAHRKPGVAVALGNPGLLQKCQRPATGPDENELGVDIPVLSSF